MQSITGCTVEMVATVICAMCATGGLAVCAAGGLGTTHRDCPDIRNVSIAVIATRTRMPLETHGTTDSKCGCAVGTGVGCGRASVPIVAVAGDTTKRKTTCRFDG